MRQRYDWTGTRSYPTGGPHGPDPWAMLPLTGGGAPAARGEFAGRGPRNYRRPDDSIREELCERLARDPEVDPSEVEVMVTDGDVLLTGNVDTREARRRIEDLAYEVSGVRDVDNRLRVGTVVHAPRPELSAADFDMPWPRRS